MSTERTGHATRRGIPTRWQPPTWEEVRRDLLLHLGAYAATALVLALLIYLRHR